MAGDISEVERSTSSLNSTSAPSNLTVTKQSKVDDDLREEERLSGEEVGTCGIVFVRWLVMAVLALLFLASLVTSKLSLLHIATHLMAARMNGTHYNATTADTTVEPPPSPPSSPESPFLMLVTAVTIPYVLTLIRSLWCGALRTDRPWPSPKACAVGIVSAVLESVGLALFTIEVLSSTSSYLCLLLMNAIFLVPNIMSVVQTSKRCHTEGNSRGKVYTLVLLVVALVLQVIGILITMVFGLHPREINDYGKFWAIPVSILFLSIAWSPQVQVAQLYPTSASLRKLISNRTPLNINDPNDQNDADTASSPSCTPSESADPTDRISEEWLIKTYPHLSARWKNSIICSSIKVILVPATCLFIGVYMDIVKMSSLGPAFSSMTPSYNHALFFPFLLLIMLNLGGYVVGWIACTVRMQPGAFSLPLCVATPLSLLLLLLTEACSHLWGGGGHVRGECHFMNEHNLALTLPAAVCLYLAQILSTGYFIFKTSTIAMQRESELFWLPGYNAIFLEQHLLLNRKNVSTEQGNISADERADRSHVIICTTMYREEHHEMEQLLLSLKRVNVARQLNNRNFEAHIVFDNGVRGSKLTNFALQLVSVAKTTLGVHMADCTKTTTPYGMRLAWELPVHHEDGMGMVLVIHLKDNHKVKNKKRWSQVMYMSYALDFYMTEKHVNINDLFILTTDADVKFSAESVAALLDLMYRDPSVGAVCARTYPLGSGPVYWYQVFDYAVGHWLQKAANHVLGSVLCCPGCFSVYRGEALRDILPTYASSVSKASEFLTKDMGEDRWLCTLMVQSGWRLEYCAAADNSTFCPDDFDEYFKQRRRWIPSTIANQMLILQEWKKIKLFNQQISISFMIYQALLLVSTFLNPSVCILIIVGGLSYAWGVNVILSSLLLILLLAAFTLICIFCKPDTQLKVSKGLSVFFIFIMAAVVIGMSVQIVEEVEAYRNHNVTTLQTTSMAVAEGGDGGGGEAAVSPVSVTTIYLGGLAGIFLVTGLLHLPEAYALLYGVLYLFTLPAGNLLLMIYSICNITDRSWGTREEKTASVRTDHQNPWQAFTQALKKLNFFSRWKRTEEPPVVEASSSNPPSPPVRSNSANPPSPPIRSNTSNPQSTSDEETPPERKPLLRKWKLGKKSKPSNNNGRQIVRGPSFLFHGDNMEHAPKPVKEWLPSNLTMYGDVLLDHGYDDTSFMVGISDVQLQELGITSRAHRNAIMEAVKKLPEIEVYPEVPVNVDIWLDAVGLTVYKAHFKHSNIVSKEHLEVLKDMSADEITHELDIHKTGHLRRLQIAIQNLRYPTEVERQASKVKYEVEAMIQLDLQKINSGEHDFWENLRQNCLLPDSVAFAHDMDLKEKLTSLRNNYLAAFIIVNAVWLLLVETLVARSQLNVFGTNPLGLCFLVIFSLVLIIQFFCMIVHRCSTWMHHVARAPSHCGEPVKAHWSFLTSGGAAGEGFDESGRRADLEANAMRRHAQEQARSRYKKSVARRQKAKRPAITNVTEA